MEERTEYHEGIKGFLIDTREVDNPEETQEEYHLRVSTEERYRHLKCFSDLTRFTSHAFSMVVYQVVFILPAYKFLQIDLLRLRRKELNQKKLPRIRQQFLPADNHLFVHYRNHDGRWTRTVPLGSSTWRKRGSILTGSSLRA